jgi:hypothetical protein
MKLLLKPLALIAALLLTSSAFAEEAKPAEWLFVHTSPTAEMTSEGIDKLKPRFQQVTN